MSVGFGFSAGDFIAALTLVHTVVDALRDSGDSSTEYRELISQLYTLETALISVKRVELDDAQHAEHVALMQAAAQCQRTIDAFWEKIKKYQPSLRAAGSGSRVKDGWRKVRWALCRKEDLSRFKADLMGHTESIEMLLTTVQMGATRIDSKRSDEQHRTMAGKMQESYFGCMQRINLVLERISTGIQQGKQLLEMTAKVFQTNVQIFQIVIKIQDIITRIPGQVERQQPVFFVDALGRHMAFHLENIGHGAKKIEKGEFVIQDSSTKIDVDLTKPWETCFRAGQHADMSMVFKSKEAWNMSCPNCRDENSDNFAKDEDIECRKCKMVYRRSMTVIRTDGLRIVPEAEHSSDAALPFGPKLELAREARAKKRNAPHDEENEMALFRRVRIKTEVKIRNPSTPPSRSRNSSPPGAPLHPAMNRRNNRGASGGATAGFRDDILSPPPEQPPQIPQIPDDPYADPELLRMLQEEREHEFPLAEPIYDSILDVDMDRNNDNDVDADGEEVLNEMEYEALVEAYEDEWEARSEIMREAAVDREINDRMLRDELPESDFSDDQSEFSIEDESEED
ncbi:hypothetical protein IFR05_002093 [Cadophora sp. M221]|nr:hypothetical protein IFR05_002093 [Cadophora sp. M221]